MRRTRTMRRWLLFFSVSLSLLLVIGSTYSWVTYSDERVNRVSSPKTALHLRLTGSYDPLFTWAPGTTTDRELAVKNEGDLPAFVRVSLYEAFLAFQVDLTDGIGNGNSRYVTTPTAKPIVADDPTTWQVGASYRVGKDKYSLGAQALVSNPEDATTAYQYKAPRPDGLAAVALHFSKGVYDQQLPSGKTDYWFYEDGAFYYSEILEPGATTSKLLTSVSLQETSQNQYKGAMYHLTPVLEGHDVTAAVLTNWGITTTEAGKLYDRHAVKE